MINADNAMEQAQWTVASYLTTAVKSCAENKIKPDPILLAAMVAAMVRDFEVAMKKNEDLNE